MSRLNIVLGKQSRLLLKMVSFKISYKSYVPGNAETEFFCQRIRTQSTFGNFEILNFQKIEFSFNFNFLTSFGPSENGIKSQDILEWSSRTSTTVRSTLLMNTNSTLLNISELYLGQPLELILELVIFVPKMVLYQLPISSQFQPAD